MIDHYALNKAFINFLLAQTGLPRIIVQGEATDIEPEESVIKEFLLPGETFRGGLRAQDHSRQDGIYQLDVLTPKSHGKWVNIQMVDLIVGKFKEVNTLVFNLQKVSIISISTTGVRESGVHFVTFMSLRYIVIG